MTEDVIQGIVNLLTGQHEINKNLTEALFSLERRLVQAEEAHSGLLKKLSEPTCEDPRCGNCHCQD